MHSFIQHDGTADVKNNTVEHIMMIIQNQRFIPVLEKPKSTVKEWLDSVKSGDQKFINTENIFMMEIKPHECTEVPYGEDIGDLDSLGIPDAGNLN